MPMLKILTFSIIFVKATMNSSTNTSLSAARVSTVSFPGEKPQLLTSLTQVCDTPASFTVKCKSVSGTCWTKKIKQSLKIISGIQFIRKGITISLFCSIFTSRGLKTAFWSEKSLSQEEPLYVMTSQWHLNDVCTGMWSQRNIAE